MYAQSLSNPTLHELCLLLDMLPSEVPPRGNAESNTKCWTTGAFSKDNVVGCRRNLRSFPHVTKVLCAFLRRVAPGFPFSAIAFFRNQLALPHQDVNNSPSVANVIVPLTSFQEGGIWIQSQSCHEVLPGQDHLGGGRVLSLKVGKPALLAHHCVHASMPWHGDRVLLVGFSPRGAFQNPSVREGLLAAGFVEPDPAKEAQGQNMPSNGEGGHWVCPAEVSDLHPFNTPEEGVHLLGHQCIPVSRAGGQAAGSSPPLLNTPEKGAHPLRPAPAANPCSVTNPRVPYLLELFCGTAGLSQAFIRAGGEALGVDHFLKTKRLKGPAVRLDLTRQDHQRLVTDEVHRADAVFLAPPCGTSSRARAIPVPPELRKRGAPCPRPLRSRREPDGIRGIRGTSLLRVKQANRLYAFCVQIMLLCIRLRIPCVVENPARSLMWETSFFRALPATLRRCLSHSCMYGSRKKKATALLSSIALPRMMRVCDGSHRHEPWGIREIQHRWHFSTSDAAEYEPGFCKALAADLLEACQAKGCVLSSERMSPLQIQAVAAGKQPRRSQVQIGPSEYGACVAVQVPQDFRIPAEITDGVASPLQGVPRGSRFLGVREVFEGGVVSTHRVWAEFGVYRPPDVFAREALKAKHPFDEPFLKDDANLAAIKSILQLGPEEVARRRAKVLDHYRRRMNELAGEEAVLKASMDPDVRRVMEGKNLLLFKEVMADAGVMDPNLFSDMLHGLRLTGELKASGQFPAALKPATIDLDHLKKTSRWAKFLIESSCKKASSDMEVAAEVWKETAEQVQRGWLKGPWSWTEVEERFQGCWVPSKRFGVQQNEKVRCVDDLSEFLINSTVTQTERIELEGLDHVVALARLFAGATMGSEDTCTLPWSDSQPASDDAIRSLCTLPGKMVKLGCFVAGPLTSKPLTSSWLGIPMMPGRRFLESLILSWVRCAILRQSRCPLGRLVQSQASIERPGPCGLVSHVCCCWW